MSTAVSAGSIFDAFFWIEARKLPSAADNSKIRSGIFKPHSSTTIETRILWHFPDDVSSIVAEFPDLPQFCFPDLSLIRLDKAGTANSASEQFTFTLTGKNAQRVYGICFRALFRGVGRRFSVGRRSRHCLCMLSSSPFSTVLQPVLQQLHAIALLEDQPGTCRRFLQRVHSEAAHVWLLHEKRSSRGGGSGNFQSLYRIETSDLYAPFDVIIPAAPAAAAQSYAASSVGQMPIVPLFEALGVERFFKLLSALLCEKRILFVADSIETLTSSVLAAVDMIHPFKWHHIFIPLLPEKLSNYLLAPMPYIIGIRRPVLSQLRRDTLDGVVLVDADSGDMKLHGYVNIRDLIGDAANTSTMQKAAETYEQMLAKVKKFAKGVHSSSASQLASRENKSGSSSNGSTSPKSAGRSGSHGDLMTALLQEIRTLVIATRPASSTYSLSAVLRAGTSSSYTAGASGGSNGNGNYSSSSSGSNSSGGSSDSSGTSAGSRSAEEARLQWAADAEKQLREILMVFYVYLFGDLYEFVKPTALLMLQQQQQQSESSRSTTNASASNSSSSRVVAIPPGGMSNAEIRRFDFSDGDRRSLFDWNDMILRRSQVRGDSKLLLEFFMEFLHSQMFEHFCAKMVAVIQKRLLVRGGSSSSGSNSSSGSGTPVEEKHTSKYTYRTMMLDAPSSREFDLSEGVFFAAAQQLQDLKISLTVQFAKQMVRRCTAAATAVGVDAIASFSSGFHDAVVQLTSGAQTLQQWELRPDSDEEFFSFDSLYPHTALYAHTSNAANSAVTTAASATAVNGTGGAVGVDATLYSRSVSICKHLDSIMGDVSDSSKIRSIMRTIRFRLECCRNSSSRGSAGLGGIRALLLLRLLLLRGPVGVVSAALDLLPTIRAIRGARFAKHQARNYLALGTFMDSSLHAGLVLNLLLDHKKLLLQRKFQAKWQAGHFAYLNSVRAHSSRIGRASRMLRRNCVPLDSALAVDRTVPSFEQLHREFNPAVKLSQQTFGVTSMVQDVNLLDLDGLSMQPPMPPPFPSLSSATSAAVYLPSVAANQSGDAAPVPPRRASALKAKPPPPVPTAARPQQSHSSPRPPPPPPLTATALSLVPPHATHHTYQSVAGSVAGSSSHLFSDPFDPNSSDPFAAASTKSAVAMSSTTAPAAAKATVSAVSSSSRSVFSDPWGQQDPFGAASVLQPLPMAAAPAVSRQQQVGPSFATADPFANDPFGKPNHTQIQRQQQRNFSAGDAMLNPLAAAFSTPQNSLDQQKYSDPFADAVKW